MDSLEQVLDCPMGQNSSGANTVRGFLREVLKETWDEQKRVFGESDWRYQVYEAFVKAGLLRGTFDEDGYLEEFDDASAEQLIYGAIDAL